MALLIVGLPETLISKKHLSMTHFYQSYRQILTNKRFIVCVLLLSVLMGYFSLFSILGPFLIQVTLQKSAIYYGKVALFMGLAWFLGNVLNRVLFRYDENSKTVFSLIVMLVSGFSLLFWSAYHSFTVLSFAVPTFLMVLASGFIFPIYIGEALTIFSSELAASANGCLFSMTWLGFGIYTLIGALLKASTPLPTAVVYVVISLLCVVLYFWAISKGARAK